MSLESAQTTFLLAATITTGLMAGVFGLYAHTIMRGLGSTDDRTFIRAAFHETRRVAWNIVRTIASTLAFGCLAWTLVLHGRV